MQNFEKWEIKMIDIKKNIVSLKVTWIKKILDSYSNGVSKEIRKTWIWLIFGMQFWWKRYTHPFQRQSISDGYFSSMEKIK